MVSSMNNDWREYTGDQDYLEHHGILGQKWGVRRFENANGHLTPAGKARYDGDKVTSKEKHAFSAKAAGYRALGALHTVNAKAPLNTKAGRTLAKAAAKQANKAADKAQKEANEKKANRTPEEQAAAEKRKKLIIAGAAVVGTAVAAYGGYKLYQLNKEATEGLSKDFSQKAANKLGEAHNLTKQASSRLNVADDFKIKAGIHTNLGNNDEAKAYKDLSSTLINRASSDLKNAKDLREEGGQLLRRAKAKNYSLKEKVAYLKEQKSNKNANRAATNKLASEASALARSVTAEGPKSFNKKSEAAQFQMGQQTSSKPAQKPTIQSKPVTQPSKTIVNNTTKIHGQEKFIDASKANDDLVQELLKKNTLKL